MTPAMSETELRALPAVIDLQTAARALGIGRTLAYQLARTGDFPCTLLRLDRHYRVVTADLLRLLGLAVEHEERRDVKPGHRDPPREHRCG